MTADERALLAAVLADPGSDLPRLVYADWLDDHGDPDRATFIRLQVAIAGLPRLVCDRDPGFELTEGAGTRGYGAGWRERCRCRPCTLHRRQRGLLQDRRRVWVREALAPVYAAYDATLVAGAGRGTPLGAIYGEWAWLFRPDLATFRRGFVEAVTLPGRAWADYGDALRDTSPIRRVTLTTLNVVADLGWGTAADWQAAYRLNGASAAEYFGGGQDLADRVHRTLFAGRWPGVEFGLPDAG